jgi:hypothetical protein
VTCLNTVPVLLDLLRGDHGIACDLGVDFLGVPKEPLGHHGVHLYDSRRWVGKPWGAGRESALRRCPWVIIRARLASKPVRVVSRPHRKTDMNPEPTEEGQERLERADVGKPAWLWIPVVVSISPGRSSTGSRGARPMNRGIFLGVYGRAWRLQLDGRGGVKG